MVTDLININNLPFLVILSANHKLPNYFLLVFDLLFILFMAVLWPSAGKEVSPWIFTCVVSNFSAVLVVHVPFPFGVWGTMVNSIVSVPDHCRFIYFKYN